VSINKNLNDDEKAKKLETSEPLAEKMPDVESKEVLEYLKESRNLHAVLVAFHFEISINLATTFLEQLERKGMVRQGFGRLGDMKIYYPSLQFHSTEPERPKCLRLYYLRIL